MAWTVTSRGTVQSLNSSANTVVPSFTPGASKLLLGWIAGYCAPTAVSGHGTWSQIGTVRTWGTGAGENLYLWACKTSGSPGASAVTFTHAGSFYRAAGIVEIDENVTGLDATVANCFGTPVSMSQYTDGSNPHTLGVTLASFANAGNLTVIVGVGDGGSTFSFTPDTGYTEAHEVGTADTQGALEYIASADTTPTIITNVNFAYVAAIAVEVKMAAAASGTLLRPRAMTGGMHDMSRGM